MSVNEKANKQIFLTGKGQEQITSAPSGVVLEIIRNGKIAYVSSALEKLTGFADYELLGRDIIQFLSDFAGEDYVKDHRQAVWRVIEGSSDFYELIVFASHRSTGENKKFSLQFESSSANFNRAIVFISDLDSRYHFAEPIGEASMKTLELLEHGKLIILRLDKNLRAYEILGETVSLIGLDAADLVARPQLWKKIAAPEDFKKLSRSIYRLIKKPIAYSQELRFRNLNTKEVRWFHYSLVPVIKDGILLSWEGFAFDITDKKIIEIELKNQTKRYNALFQVAHSINNNQNNPEAVALGGLNALIKAIGCCAGAVLFSDRSGKRLELAAVTGFEADEIGFLSSYLYSKNNFFSLAMHRPQGVIINTIKPDSYFADFFSSWSAVKSLMAVPLSSDNASGNSTVRGIIVLACKNNRQFSYLDLELLQASAAQITVAAQQAELNFLEKQQSNTLNILYHLSHQLTKALSPEEVAAILFPVLLEQCGAKRIWFGISNEGGSHVVGVSGYGPGVRKEIQHVQIELALTHDHFDEAWKTKKPVIFKPEAQTECSGLNRVMQILKPELLIIMPLVTVGQVMGMLVIEPHNTEVSEAKAKLPLLNSIANEVAIALIARRYEERLAQSNKMRMAGLLASGIAHNFNNLLQAVIGQASLMELQIPKDSPLQSALKIIQDSSVKGADLIKKLTQMSTAEISSPKPFSPAAMLKESKEIYESIIGSRGKLNYLIRIGTDLKVLGDYYSIQQILANLLINSRDATEQTLSPRVMIAVTQQNVRTAEISPDLAPGKYVRIDIKDNGVGMNAEQLHRCFEPFFTTKNADSGTGVGFSGSGLSLANAYSVVRKHAGIIVAHSKIGRGTVFSIFLPVYEGEISEGTERQGNLTANMVVIAGSTADLHPGVFTVLDRNDFSVLQIRSLNDLSSYYKQHSFVPKLLVLDLDRCDSQIIDTLKDIRQRYPLLRILAYTLDEKRWSSLLRFFDGLTVTGKPLGLISLHNTLKKMLESGNTSLLDKILVDNYSPDEVVADVDNHTDSK